MAKPFYSLEEVCELLGKSEDDVRAMVRAGSLREFRDAGKIFFKAEDVDQLSGAGAGRSGDTDEIRLEPAEEELPDLSGDPSAGTSVIGLMPSDDDDNKRKKEGTVITKSGIGVFDDDELEIDADPLAATQITTGAPEDQVTLEGTGSGSGLMDLTRESDDTSLGAELLDEIYPGEEDTDTSSAAVAEEPEEFESSAPEAEAAEEEAEPVQAAPAPVMISAAPVGDTSEGLFSGLLVGAILLLALAASVGAAGLQNFLPSYAATLTNNFWFFLGGAALLPIICLLVGWVVGRAAAR